VREHQAVFALGALGALGVVSLGYYSGLFSGSGDRSRETKKGPMPFYKKGIVMTK